MQLTMHHHGFLASTIAQRIVEVLLMQKRSMISQWEIEIVPVEGSISLRHRGLPFATLRRDRLDLILASRDIAKCIAQDAVLTMLDIPIDLMCYNDGGFASFFFMRDKTPRTDLTQGNKTLTLACQNLFEKVVAYANPTTVESAIKAGESASSSVETTSS